MSDRKLNRNDIVLSWLFTVAKLIAFVLFIFSAFRLFFIFYFGDIEQISTMGKDLTLSLIYGLRYDLIVVSYFFLPVLLIGLFTPVFLSVRLKNFLNFFVRLYGCIICLVVFIVLSVDMGFYLYFQDHINILIYGVFEDDTWALVESVRKNYPLPLFGAATLIYILFTSLVVFKLAPPLKRKVSVMRQGFVTYLIMCLITVGLYAGAIRGGYSEVVLAPKYNDFSSNEFMNLAAVNGFLALENAVRLRKTSESSDFNLAQKLGYKKGIKEAFSDYLGLDMSYVKEEEVLQLLNRRTEKNNDLERLRPHVVVVMAESFGSYWNKFNSKSFDFLGGLKDHFESDYYFDNFISGANGTVGSLMILTSNIPTRPGARFLSESKYLQVPLSSAAHIPYKQNGYETNFLYGGKLGWRDIGKYYRRQNYKNIIGENKIRKTLSLAKDQGTEWGIFDEHLFSMVETILKNAKRPQFIMVLTTTNHPPFEVPSSFKGASLIVPVELERKIKREREGFDQRFRAFQYSNYAFSNFLTSVKNSNLAEKTVVAMTGDHNFWGYVNFDQEQVYEKHLVPFYVYLPEALKVTEVDQSKVGSHEDIMTSLYNVTLSDTTYLSFGENMFSPSESYAINQKVYASSKGAVYKDRDYKWDDMPLIQKNPTERFLNNLRKRYRSSLSVSDYYLQRSLDEFNNKEKSN